MNHEDLLRDAIRYRNLRVKGHSLRLYVYEDPSDPFSGEWVRVPSPELIDQFADGCKELSLK
jgi:hypothetical protein